MQIRFELDSAQWFSLFALGFLEDVYRLRAAPVSGHTRLWHVARFLGACATNLRNACEAKFDGDFRRVPNQDLMWFVSATRHLHAHGGPGGAVMQVSDSNLDWSNDDRKGLLETEAFITINLEDSSELKSQSSRAAAARFLMNHDGRLYLAMHAAAREVCTWTA